ncbi:ARR3 Arsenical-resistance protein 3 [Candida maltosa Xu316]|uniref:Putative arsenite transporter n=1 Tax=Candida maltosa (strain Xu316) TaxID=1245528 RepID=M3IHM5_CANMX|nr:putative arsenite transporter [Candida maltosa Xu316]
MAFKEDARAAFRGLSITDKLLPLLIVLAIIIGVLISVYVPKSGEAFDGAKVVGVSVPLAVGMIVMMIPPLCKVEWENFHKFFSRTTYLRPILVSLVLNWIICPFIMFGFAWLVLFNYDEYRTGIIMIGIARCIAMVLLWNEIALGDNTLCAVIVLINSLMQVVLYAPYQLFFCYVITGHAIPVDSGVSYEIVAKSVAFFLGIPLALGVILRFVLKYFKAYEKLMPFISPWALIGLLYTIIVIFIDKGKEFIKEVGTAFLCFIPLTLYFLVAWITTFFVLRWMAKAPRLEDENTKLLCGCEEKIEKNPTKWKRGCSANYAQIVTQSFTAASNNFELSLAIAISIYGSGSKQAIAATFGPLLEVPILLLLTFVARYFRTKFIWADVDDEFEEVHAL